MRTEISGRCSKSSTSASMRWPSRSSRTRPMQPQTLAIRCSRLMGVPEEPVNCWHSSLTVRPSFNFAVAFIGPESGPSGWTRVFLRVSSISRRKASLIGETVDDHPAVQQGGGGAVFDAELSVQSGLG